MNYLFSCLLFIFSISLAAQPKDYVKYTKAFDQRVEMYGNWLKKSGLGEVISVKEHRVTQSGISINLGFLSDDPHEVKAAWETLKVTFEATSGLTLEQELFYKARSLTDIPSEDLLVQLFNTYDPVEPALFAVHIYSEAGKVEVEKSIPRAITKQFVITPPDLHVATSSGEVDFRERFTKEQVFSCILKYAKERYEVKKCKNRQPSVTLISQIDLLEFEVTDLCMEVVQDGNPRLCAYLDSWGYECNWAEREMYVFRVIYDELAEGFRLTIEIDGKVGSGWYNKVKVDGYLSIEDDFAEEFAKYAKIITNEIHQQLIATCN